MSGLRGQLPGGLAGGTDRYGAAKQSIVFWDLSKAPKDNSERDKKLGGGDATGGMAIGSFNESSLAAIIADGLKFKNGASSVRLLEPDNWALRLHASEGKGKDCVWSLRLIADHENKTSSRTHRSTMIVDQCKEQNWAWLSDALWIKNLKAVVSSDELVFDKAGFLSGALGLDPLGKAAKKLGRRRGATMINISKRGGYITDGKAAAQLWHILHIQSGFGGVQTTGTVAKPKVPTPAGACGVVREEHGALRGDVDFACGSQLAHLDFSDVPLPPPPIGKILYGFFHIAASSGPLPPLEEMDSDKNSNQKILPRVRDAAIRPHVRISEISLVFAASVPAEMTAAEIPIPTGAVSTPARFGPGVTTINGVNRMTLPAGRITAVYRTATLPQNTNELDLWVQAPLTIPAALSGVATIDLSLFWRKWTNPNDTISGSWTEIPLRLTAADFPGAYGGANKVKVAAFRILRIGVNSVGQGGGQFAFYLVRANNDLYPNAIHLVNQLHVFERPTGQQTLNAANMKVVA